MSQGEPVQPPTMARAELQASLEAGGPVALVKVDRTEVIGAGTRSERTVIDATVERALFGQAGQRAELTRYTHGGDPVLREGRRYVVAAHAVPRLAPRLVLDGFVEVPDGMEGAYLDAHRRLIEDIKG